MDIQFGHLQKKMVFFPHYWINGMTHTKRTGALIVMIEEEEAEVVEWLRRWPNWDMG